MRPPDRTEHKERAVEFVWDVGPGKPDWEPEGVVRQEAVLRVAFDKAGANYMTGVTTTEDSFTVALSAQERGTRPGGITMVRFALFNGIGLARLPSPTSRFSRKRLDAAAAEGLRILQTRFDGGDGAVHRYFESMEVTA